LNILGLTQTNWTEVGIYGTADGYCWRRITTGYRGRLNILLAAEQANGIKEYERIGS